MADVFDNIPADLKSLIALCAFGLLLLLAGLTEMGVARFRCYTRRRPPKPPVAPPGA
jgi:hypothetical protein